MSLPAPRWTLSALAVAVPLLAQADGGLEEEIVVTAARMASPLEVVTDPRLPRQPLPAHDGADYLKTVSGFSVIRKGGTDGDPLFRGMAGSRVAVLNEEAMLLGGCGNRMDPPTAYVVPQSYDRIRILKGPQSVLWAPGASRCDLLSRWRPRWRPRCAGAGAFSALRAWLGRERGGNRCQRALRRRRAPQAGVGWPW